MRVMVSVLPESDQTKATENSHQQGKKHHNVGVPAGENYGIGLVDLVNICQFMAHIKRKEEKMTI